MGRDPVTVWQLDPEDERPFRVRVALQHGDLGALGKDGDPSCHAIRLTVNSLASPISSRGGSAKRAGDTTTAESAIRLLTKKRTRHGLGL